MMKRRFCGGKPCGTGAFLRFDVRFGEGGAGGKSRRLKNGCLRSGCLKGRCLKGRCFLLDIWQKPVYRGEKPAEE